MKVVGQDRGREKPTKRAHSYRIHSPRYGLTDPPRVLDSGPLHNDAVPEATRIGDLKPGVLQRSRIKDQRHNRDEREGGDRVIGPSQPLGQDHNRQHQHRPNSRCGEASGSRIQAEHNERKHKACPARQRQRSKNHKEYGRDDENCRSRCRHQVLQPRVTEGIIRFLIQSGIVVETHRIDQSLILRPDHEGRSLDHRSSHRKAGFPDFWTLFFYRWPCFYSPKPAESLFS